MSVSTHSLQNDSLNRYAESALNELRIRLDTCIEEGYSVRELKVYSTVTVISQGGNYSDFVSQKVSLKANPHGSLFPGNLRESHFRFFFGGVSEGSSLFSALTGYKFVAKKITEGINISKTVRVGASEFLWNSNSSSFAKNLDPVFTEDFKTFLRFEDNGEGSDSDSEFGAIETLSEAETKVASDDEETECSFSDDEIDRP
jgi:hypothetical protein